MKFPFLPEEIKVDIDESLGEDPLALARSNMAIDGHMGESFIIGYEDIFYFFSKAMGSQVYTKTEGKYSDISSLSVSKDEKHSIIQVELGKKKYTMKFSHLEEVNLVKMQGQWLSFSLSAYTALLAALMYLASEDDELAGEENDYILKIADGNDDLLEKAHSFYLSQPIDTLYKILGKLTEDQQYCIMANLLELAMCDGVLHADEIKLIKSFAKSMDVDDDQYETVKQVMVMKNQLGILKD